MKRISSHGDPHPNCLWIRLDAVAVAVVVVLYWKAGPRFPMIYGRQKAKVRVSVSGL